MTKFVVGLCSWTDRSLIESGFYPKGARTPAARLAYCGERFDALEIDSSFYAIPDRSLAFRWIACTPDRLKFGIKAFSLFTFHTSRYKNLPRWAREAIGPRDPEAPIVRDDLSHASRVKLFDDFAATLRSLKDAGRLAYVLFQFPRKFVFSTRALAYIKSVRRVAGPLPLAVEFRHSSWLAGENKTATIRALERENIAYTAVDEPHLPWTLGPDWPITADWGGLARFHGRNARAWSAARSTVGEKFDHDYTDEELAPWRERALAAAESSRPEAKIYMMFNNCVGDKAVRASEKMRAILDLPQMDAGQRLLYNEDDRDLMR